MPDVWHSIRQLTPGGPAPSDRSESQRPLVSELLVAYLEFAETYYSNEGQPTKEFRGMVDAVGPLNHLYGDTLADEFGPLKLKAVREHIVEQGLCRTEVNKRIGLLSTFNIAGFIRVETTETPDQLCCRQTPNRQIANSSASGRQLYRVLGR